MKKAALLVLMLASFGCQQEPKKSVFDDWQPPPIRPQRVLKSDAVLPRDKPGPAVMPPKITEPEKLQKPLVDLIIVSIHDQRLKAYHGEELLRECFCSTAAGGKVLPTSVGSDDPRSEDPHDHIGKFNIFYKDAKHVSIKYHCPMPYALEYFEGHYIHATEPKFYKDLGSPASHGCIRLNLDDAKWLYSHTPVGCELIITVD